MSTYKRMMNLKIRENVLEQMIGQLNPHSTEWDHAYTELSEVEHEIAQLDYRTDYKYHNHFK